MKKLFAKQLKKIRLSLYMEQILFAGLIGVSLDTLKNWEYCRSLPTQRHFRELIDKLSKLSVSKEDINQLSHLYVSAKADIKQNNQKPTNEQPVKVFKI